MPGESPFNLLNRRIALRRPHYARRLTSDFQHAAWPYPTYLTPCDLTELTLWLAGQFGNLSHILTIRARPVNTVRAIQWMGLLPPPRPPILLTRAMHKVRSTGSIPRNLELLIEPSLDGVGVVWETCACQCVRPSGTSRLKPQNY